MDIILVYILYAQVALTVIYYIKRGVRCIRGHCTRPTRDVGECVTSQDSHNRVILIVSVIISQADGHAEETNEPIYIRYQL